MFWWGACSVLEGCGILEEALAVFWRGWHFLRALAVSWRGVTFLEGA